MNLKNYTTEVNADTTLAKIERALVSAGATGIAKEYKDGRCAALVFQLPMGPGKPPTCIQLPANVAACHQAMWQEHCRTRSFRSRKTDKDFLPQAERTAWRIMQDWVEVQLSLIHLRQIDTLQAFLPYCYDPATQTTLYQRIKTDDFRALMPPGTAGPA